MKTPARNRKPDLGWMLSLLIALFTACASSGGGTNDSFGGQTGAEADKCEREDPVELAMDEVSPLGFSPAEIVDFTQGTHEAELRWTTGETTALTVEVTVTGPASFVVIEPIPSTTEGPQLEITVVCEDEVTIPIRLTVSSADGRVKDEFDDRFLEVTRKEEVTLLETLFEFDAVDEELSRIDLDDYEGIDFHIEMSFGPERFEGRIFGVATRFHSDRTTSATSIELANWGDHESNI